MTRNNINNNNTPDTTFTVIIQARMDSTRLPGKAMLDLGGKPLLAHVIERAKAIRDVQRVVLATGSAHSNRPIIELARSMDINTFTGSDDNVLDRYYKAHEEYGGDYIIRATGDNPFMDPHYAERTMSMALENNADLCSITNLPIGIAIEIIKSEALRECYKKSTMPHQLEHVTPYIKENKSLFQILHTDITYNNAFPYLRLTVDEDQDYLFAQKLYRDLYNGSVFYLEEIFQYISQHPDLLDINRNVRQKSMFESSISEK